VGAREAAGRRTSCRTKIWRCLLPPVSTPAITHALCLHPPAVWPIVMPFAFNIFMTFAWYGHLKHKGAALFIAIVVSWALAFFEYCLAVPANRIGSQVYSTAQLKTIQEVITLLVFSVFRSSGSARA
jgi:uncharacterized protein